MSEIADNKWEASAAKPPINSVAAIAQILMFGGFALIFAWMLIFSLIGAFGPNKGGDLEERYKKMREQDQGGPAAAPAPEG